MVSALYIIGVIVFVLSIITGFLSRSFTGVVAGLVGGVTSSVIFFALAKIIENQESILYKMDYKEEIERKLRAQEKKTCPKCDYKYDGDYSSCPHCGYKE